MQHRYIRGICPIQRVRQEIKDSKGNQTSASRIHSTMFEYARKERTVSSTCPVHGKTCTATKTSPWLELRESSTSLVTIDGLRPCPFGTIITLTIAGLIVALTQTQLVGRPNGYNSQFLRIISFGLNPSTLRQYLLPTNTLILKHRNHTRIPRGRTS